ncbi:MAG: BrnA antitoxin family protein [Thiocapsa sp.]|nr:CopG family antitoxin [Thiocapsa sp.]MCG6897890.1 BrnA antitoxin family protein [Thiocapsa sp.]MCG6984148.1 BrnA antitoxin family protein [Thiocapsa sp.]
MALIIFWEGHDSSDHLDWTRAELARSASLKPSTSSIPLGPPVSPMDRIKIEANARDMPYQSLIKPWLAEDVARQQR